MCYRGAVASSRLMEFVPHTVCRVLTRRKFQYFVVPLRVFWEAPERVVCEVKVIKHIKGIYEKVTVVKSGRDIQS